MKRKFIKSGVRAGAATMAVVLGSGSILLSEPAVVHAQNNEIVQESLIGAETEEMLQPEEAPKTEETTETGETQPEETKPEENIQEEQQEEETSETEVSEESGETEAAQVYAERIASPGAVINENTVWSYLDNNTDPAEGLESRQSWTAKDFNDSAWKSTAGRFGAKNGALVSFDGFTPTVLLQQYINDTKTDVPTFFFRTKFNIENPEEIGSITATVFHDDGVVVYLNGNEIYRAGMVVKNDADPAATNMYYAGENGGAPKEANITVTEEDVQKYAVEGENVLAVELHNDRETSSDVYFEFAELMVNQKTEAPSDVTQKSVFLTVGSDESSRNLTWYADAAEAGEVQYAPKAADGEFPAEFQTATAASKAANEAGFYSNQATLANLQENTEYVYRVVNGATVSDTYSFKTEKKDGSFKFAFVGDPQIGAGSTAKDIEGWNATVGIIKDTLNSEFVLSAGDQVNTATNEEQYAGYLNEAFASIPSATSVGNHDSGSAAYQEHFNLPNESGKGSTAAGSDYWYVYGNTLFMDINTNNKSAEEHKAFMEEAIAANKDVKWKTVVFHHSVYSTASHVNDKEIVDWRNSLPPIFEELGIDVVLMGHDHVYTRTYMMDGKQQHAEAEQKAEDKEWVNPKGTLYLTANSASGSKYYDIKAADAAYSAKMDQSKRRTVTDVEVTDTTYTVKTYFAEDMSVLDEFTIKKETPAKPVTQKSVFLTVGSDESSRNLTWYADAAEAGEVQYAPKAADGEFPAEFQTATAASKAANEAGFYSNQATLANLQENTEYVYRVVNGATVSDTYSFKTEKKDGSFKFAFVGDPQIGAGSTAKDIEGWNATVGIIKDTLNSEFVLSAGDQVNTATNEEQYAGYLNEAFASIPSATSVGNHDSGSAAYQEHFNLPNESGKGSTAAGSDYWYVYGNTLFMDINTNNKSAEEHKAFMEEAIAANKDVKWKTVVFHHSVYSTASHVNDKEIVDWRNSLPPIFEELGIDVVLMGHDHVYTRTYMMDGKQQHAEAEQKAEDKEWVNPKGTLYLTANSASGSKYYDIKAADAAYSAKMDQSKRRTVTDVEVTDTTYTVKTYFAEDMTVLDEFTIKKEAPVQETVDKSGLEAVIKDAAEKAEKDYTAESWNAFKEAYEAAQEVEADKDATQESVDAAKAALETAMGNLVKEEGETPTPETVDKSGLEAVIKDAAEKAEKDYTAESWNAFKEAYEAAQEVEADKDATQESVDAAKAALETAMGNLVKEEGETPTPETVDKSKLEAVIKDAAEKAEKDYTAESWKAFKEAYEAAQKVKADKDATQEEVDAAKAALETAMSKLVKKTAIKPGANANNGTNVNNGKPGSNVSSGVKTGDSSKPILMSLLMLVSGSLAALVKKKRKLIK